MLFQRVLFLSYALVVASTCSSVLDADCSKEIKEGNAACIKCAEAHKADLEAANCTTKTIEGLCSSPGPSPGPGPAVNCSSQLDKDCKPWTRKSKVKCEKCAESHEADLKKVCTTAELKALCGGSGPSPGPGPGPSPGPGPGPSSETLKLVLLDNSDNAVGGRCMDGSPAAYYYGEPLPNATDKWIIFLEGGGACYTEQGCTTRSKTALGSSTKFKPYENLDGKCHLLCSGDANVNPDFFDGHRVFVPYCTSDVHSGQRTSTSAETWGFWFDGHLNIQRILADLKTKYGLMNATQVLLTGTSAGGKGTFQNADYVASQLPDATVKAAPQAGWFFPEDPTALPKGAGLPLDFASKEVSHNHSVSFDNTTDLLWQPYVNPSCISSYPAEEGYYCGSVHNQYKFVTTPLLVVENQFDTNQLFAQMHAPKKPKDATEAAELKDYISYYGGLMRDSIIPQIKAHGQTKAKGKDGLFLPSCLAHGMPEKYKLPVSTSDSDAVSIGYMEVLGDWFFERGKLASHILVDDCKMTDGQPCNPTCPNKIEEMGPSDF